MAEFKDRVGAGRELARIVGRVPSSVVLGLPRGGVVVAAEVARVAGAPLDILVVRKIGVPSHPEVAMGALGEGGVVVRNAGVIRRAGVTEAAFEAAADRERRALEARVRRWRGDAAGLDLAGRTVFLVDDGIATGATVRAASAVARQLGTARIVVATPVAPAGLTAFDVGADQLLVVAAPNDFRAVGMHYDDFDQTSDAAVTALLGG